MSKRQQRNKPNATGRNDTSRFVRLDYRILNSNAYRSLSPNSRALLVELGMLFNGENNGSLFLSVRDAAHRMGVADTHAASRAFDDLQTLGFIEMTQDAHFSVKAADGSRARCWRLTWLQGPGRKLPSWAFMEREPAPQTVERKRMERGLRALKTYRRMREQNKMPVVDSLTMTTFPSVPEGVAVMHSTTPNPANGSFQPKAIIGDSTTHIAITMGESLGQTGSSN